MVNCKDYFEQILNPIDREGTESKFSCGLIFRNEAFLFGGSTYPTQISQVNDSWRAAKLFRSLTVVLPKLVTWIFNTTVEPVQVIWIRIFTLALKRIAQKVSEELRVQRASLNHLQTLSITTRMFLSLHRKVKHLH